MSKKETYDFAEFVTSNYISYGKTVNRDRAVPSLDGLKPVHRRILLGLKEVANGKLTAANNGIGAIQVLHPFGDSGIFGAMSDMARLKAIDSYGSVGIKLMTPVPAAAARYWKVGLTKAQSKFWFRLLEYSPLIESDVGLEPEYLITPVPYCLVYGAQNLGFGAAGRTPAFTYESLLEAWLKDDPQLLVPQFGYKFDRDKSDLQELWDKGTGRVQVRYNVEKLNDNEILLHGSGETFAPNLRAFNKLLEEGKIEILDVSGDEVALRIRKLPRARVDINEILDICKRVGTFNRRYNIIVVENDVVRNIGIKEWLDITINRFIETFDRDKGNRVAKLNKDIEVLKLLPQVGQLLLEDKSDEEILGAVEGLTPEILEAIKRKSISSLRRKDSSAEIAAIEKRIQEVQAEDPRAEMMKPM